MSDEDLAALVNELAGKSGLGGLDTGTIVDFALEVAKAVRERCAKLCESEHVGRSIDDDDLVCCDLAYNRALKHAAASIRAASGV